ncbi:MAG: hypothetical protein ACSLFB_03905 [Acidimicrobiales bacterium]
MSASRPYHQASVEACAHLAPTATRRNWPRVRSNGSGDPPSGSQPRSLSPCVVEELAVVLCQSIPHVGYVQVVLTEMSKRTFIGLSGRRYSGEEIISSLWDTALADSMGVLEDQNRMFVLSEV